MKDVAALPRSPWDGESRAPLRWAIAGITAIEIVTLAGYVHHTPPGPMEHPHAPAALLALGGGTWSVALIAMVGLAALVAFARRRAPLASGLSALAVFAILCEAHAALTEGPRRSFFGPGAVLLGWCCGLAFARVLRIRDAERDGSEALAEAGALAALAATYVDAALSKLTHVGLLWADDLTLRGVIATQHPFHDGSLLGAYARLVLEHPDLSRALSTATLVIQIGAVLMALGPPRLRMTWATLISLFHFNVALLTGIGYLGTRALVLLFGFPWPRIARRVRAWIRREPAAATKGAAVPREPAVPRRALLGAVAIVAAVVALAWLSPIRGYAALHHHHRPGAPAIATAGAPSASHP